MAKLKRKKKSKKLQMQQKVKPAVTLKYESPLAEKAITLMNEGQWEEALEELNDLPRKSSDAPLKMLCKAMVCFYEENDAQMQKALSLIPYDHQIKPIANRLENIFKQDLSLKDKVKTLKDLSCLWIEGESMEKGAAYLRENIRRKNFKNARRSIIKFSEIMYPEEPLKAQIDILNSLSFLILSQKISKDDFSKLVNATLPRKISDLVIARNEYELFEDPLINSGNFIRLLNQEFSDPKERDMAHAMVLHNTVKQLIDFGAKEPDAYPNQFDEIFGVKLNKIKFIPLEMLIKATELDPYNKEYYELLIILERPNREAKNLVEAALEKMLDLFPNDPFPCLGLASVYHEKNAYRKTEKILEEAAKRAPHDQRVTDRKALSCLISAHKNFKKRKHHLMEKDFENAEKLNSTKVHPFIIEKKILYNLMILYDSTLVAETIFNEIKNFSTYDGFRVLSLLCMDLEFSHYGNSFPDMRTIVLDLFKTAIGKMKELTFPEIVKLVSPLERDFLMIMPIQSMAKIFSMEFENISKEFDWSQLFAFIEIFMNDKELTEIKRFHERIIKEVKRRRKKAPKSEKLIYDFYFKALKLIYYGFEVDPEELQIIKNKANEKIFGELKNLSKRLSRYIDHPYLKEAFENFDFTPPQTIPSIFNPMNIFNFDDDDFDDDDFDDDDFDDDDFDDDMGMDDESMLEMINMFKNMIGIMEEDPSSNSNFQSNLNLEMFYETFIEIVDEIQSEFEEPEELVMFVDEVIDDPQVGPKGILKLKKELMKRDSFKAAFNDSKKIISIKILKRYKKAVRDFFS